MISLIAAIGRARELGFKNELLWRIPDDLRRFKALTLTHPVVMGRKTFESIGKPLPGRTNIVVTRNKEWKADGVEVASSIEEALFKSKKIDTKEVFVIGGAEIYAAALPYADRLYLTLIDNTAVADTHFPDYAATFPTVISEEKGMYKEVPYRWVILE